jgi:prolipoprotein diacylglyceryltransferase
MAPCLRSIGLSVQAFPLLPLTPSWAGVGLSARLARRSGLNSGHIYNSKHSFVLFVALYAGSRLLPETFRFGAPLMGGGIRTLQVVALAVILGTVWYLYRRRFPEAAGVSRMEAKGEA